jgi:hypothetical protein
MKRRREHGECESREGGRGCIILGTPVCTFTKRREPTLLALMRKWMRKLTALNIAFSCLILLAAVAFRMRAIGIAPDLGVCLAPTVTGPFPFQTLNRLWANQETVLLLSSKHLKKYLTNRYTHSWSIRA